MKQRTRKKSIWIALAVILVIVVLLLCLGIRKASKDELAEREKAVKDAVGGEYLSFAEYMERETPQYPSPLR